MRMSHPDASTDTLASYLRAKRHRADPPSLGVPVRPGRRLTGLRREELAGLAGISLGYYKRLEQGINVSPSRQVVLALARALALDSSDAAHLLRLAGHAPTQDTRATSEQVAQMTELVNSLHRHAAVLISPARYVVTATRLAVVMDPAFAPGNNMLEQHFLNPDVRSRVKPWARIARAAAAAARATLADHGPNDDLQAVVEVLLLKSVEFAEAWNDRRVGPMYDGSVRIAHPVVGPLDLHVSRLRSDAVPGYAIMLFHPAPDAVDPDALRRLLDVTH